MFLGLGIWALTCPTSSAPSARLTVARRTGNDGVDTKILLLTLKLENGGPVPPTADQGRGTNVQAHGVFFRTATLAIETLIRENTWSASSHRDLAAKAESPMELQRRTLPCAQQLKRTEVQRTPLAPGTLAQKSTARHQSDLTSSRLSGAPACAAARGRCFLPPPRFWLGNLYSR